MKNIGIIGFVIVAALMQGCASNGKAVTELGKAYYKVNGELNKQRTFTSVRIAGSDTEPMTITMTGVHEIVLESPLAPLPPVTALPRDPSTLSTLMDGGSRLATIVGASAVGMELARGAGETQIVNQPEPLVLRPEVITTRN